MTLTTNFTDVGDFHEKFNLDNVTHHFAGPRKVTKELLEFRIKFMQEELDEFVKAVSVIDKSDGEVIVQPETIDHKEAFDALLDLAYVAFGTAHFLGYPWQAGWDNVHGRNMAKERGKPDGSNSKRGSSYDVVKPAGWYPPDHGPTLRAYGFDV